jgi:MFS family permease
MSATVDSDRRFRRLTAAWRGGPLQNRDFRLLSAGQLTSTIGDYCYAVALPWLILSTHGGTVLLGTVLACYGVPRTVLIPVGGILADKIGPRTVMLAADAVRCVLVALLALLASRQTVTLAMLGPVAALLGAGEGVFIPASFTIMPAIVEPDRLQAGNALSAAMIQVGSLAGPVLGGLLVTTAGPVPAFAVDAASFGISAVALALISVRRLPAPVAQPDASDAQDPAADAAATQAPVAAERDPAATVWSLLRRSRLLQVIVVICIVANLASGGTYQVAMPALAHARFGAAGYGAMIACLGAGGLIGSLVATRAGSLRRPAQIACIAFLFEGTSTCLVPYVGGLAGASAAILVLGICNGFGNIVMFTLLQQWAPSHLLGRVISLVMLASLGANPASAALAGVLVRHLGPSPFFPVGGIVLIVAILGALTQRSFRDFGVTPAGGPADQAAELAR